MIQAHCCNGNVGYSRAEPRYANEDQKCSAESCARKAMFALQNQICRSDVTCI
jgi:hypothetical protein